MLVVSSAISHDLLKRALHPGISEKGELLDALASRFFGRPTRVTVTVASGAEAADLAYHVLVGFEARGVDPAAVALELARRFGVSGLVEKASRPLE